MLSEREKKFLTYWEANRERQKKGLFRLGLGLPMALALGIFILANYYSGWYKRAEMVANSRFNPLVLYFAVAAIVVFVAIFSKKFHWDQYEQRFQELKRKQQTEDKTNQAT